MFRHVVRVEFTAGDRALAMLAVVATITSLFLGFSAGPVWERFATAQQAVVEEASSVGQTAGAAPGDLGANQRDDCPSARPALRE